MSRYKQLVSSPLSAEQYDRALRGLGAVATHSGRFDIAEEAYRELLVRNPLAGGARHEALWGLGWVAFRSGLLRRWRA